MDSLQNFTTFTKTYYNVVCSRDALSHFIRCWWEIISSVQILLYACTTFPCISFERHEGKDKIKCYFMPLLCTFLYIYFEYELYVWCQWVRRNNIIVFYEICSSILSKYCNIMVIIIFITPRDDVMQTLYIVWAEWWWRLLSPLAGHVWYGVAHNSIFLHLFSILLLRLSVRENTATAKSHFTDGKRSVSDDYPIFSPECRHFILDLCTSKSIRIFS